MIRPGGDELVENIPMPQASIPAEVKLSGADAADGHPDIFEFAPAQDFRCAPREQGLYPIRRKFFVRRHQMVKILAREGPGHDRQAGEGQPQRGGGGDFEKIAAGPLARRNSGFGFHVISLDDARLGRFLHPRELVMRGKIDRASHPKAITTMNKFFSAVLTGACSNRCRWKLVSVVET